MRLTTHNMMRNITIFSLFIFSLICNVFGDSSDYTTVVNSRVQVSKCRAECVAQLHDTSCQRSVCQDCWQRCDALQNIGNQAICEHEGSGLESNPCGEGCQIACSSYFNNNSIVFRSLDGGGRRRKRLEFSSLPILSGCKLSWGKLRTSINSIRKSAKHHKKKPAKVLKMAEDPVVYLTLARDRTGAWYEVSQLLDQHISLNPATLTNLDQINVIGVGQKGIMAVKTIAVPKYVDNSCEISEVARSTTVASTTVAAATKAGTGILREPFKIEIIGMEKMEDNIPQVIITWTDNRDTVQPGESKFLVRWRQIPLGPVSGSMLTNASVAKLPLLSTADVLVEVTRLTPTGAVPATSLLYLNQLDQPFGNLDSYESEAFLPIVPTIIISIIILVLFILILFIKVKFCRPQEKIQDVENNNNCNFFGSPKAAKAEFTLIKNCTVSHPTKNVDVLNFIPPKIKDINSFNESIYEKKLNV